MKKNGIMANQGSRRVWLAYALTFIAALLPTLLLLDPSMVMDDTHYVRGYVSNPFSKGFEPFVFNNTYWRPVATLTMAVPMAWFTQIGEGNVMLISKAVSLAMFAMVGLAAGRLATRGASAPKAWIGALAGALVALHPMFAEPAMLWSDRPDLMLCGFVVLMMSLFFEPPTKWTPLKAFAFAALACLTKESGFFWSAGAAALALLAQGKQGWKLAGPILAATAACALARFAVVQHVAPAFKVIGDLGHGTHWSPDLFLINIGHTALLALAPLLDPAALHFADQWVATTRTLGTAALAAFAWLCWATAKARRTWAAERAFTLGWCALALLVMFIQQALFAFPDAPSTSDFAVVPTRYGTVSFLMILVLLARAAMGQGKAKRPAQAAMAALLALSLSVSITVKTGHTSMLDLWASVYSVNPTEASLKQYVKQLKLFGYGTKASEVIDAWRADHPGKMRTSLDAFLALPVGHSSVPVD